MFEIFPELEVLDGIDQNGNEMDSEEDVGDEYGEEEDDDISEETRKRLAESGFELAGKDEEDEEYDAEEDFDDEDLEGDLYGDEDDDSDSEEPAAKRPKK